MRLKLVGFVEKERKERKKWDDPNSLCVEDDDDDDDCGRCAYKASSFFVTKLSVS